MFAKDNASMFCLLICCVYFFFSGFVFKQFTPKRLARYDHDINIHRFTCKLANERAVICVHCSLFVLSKIIKNKMNAVNETSGGLIPRCELRISSSGWKVPTSYRFEAHSNGAAHITHIFLNDTANT